MTDKKHNIATVTLPKNVDVPRYDRRALRPRVVHIGFGAFHRAHQALLTHRVLNQEGGDWGLCEVVLFSDDSLISALREQQHLFTVLEKGESGNQAIVVGAVCASLHAAVEGKEAILAQLADAQTEIVSLTITEKGYCLAGAHGNLDTNNAHIQHDLRYPREPLSVPGIITEALRRRHAQGIPPFSVLSCDNMPENGKAAQRAVLDFARLIAPTLAAWIEREVAFPSTMVDRIVPAATAQTLHDIAEAIGVDDPCAIACEPYIQWVVEDRFTLGRPHWEAAGVQLVEDVAPYETMKLRMLNGSHSFLAYLGYLAGYAHINDCMADAHFRRAVRHLMLAEQAPTLTIAGVNLTDYAERLLARFANPALQHRTWQIAMDGSQKLPQRLLDGLRWHRRNGSRCEALILGVAGWMRYIGGIDDRGEVIDIRDPLKTPLQSIVASTPDDETRVRGLLALTAVFGDDLRTDPLLVHALTDAYLRLRDQGALATVTELAQSLCD